jgi:predicted neuraminidase
MGFPLIDKVVFSQRIFCMYKKTLVSITCLLVTALTAFATDDPAILHEGFIYDEAPYPECHASTIEETPLGLVAAWFGGTGERFPDVGIWVSRQIDGQWAPSVEVANGVQYTLTDGKEYRHPTWNPVLYQYPDGPLVLFWKCGPSPSTWWGMMSESLDHGVNWSAARRLPEHIEGPVRNKPILLKNGTLLSGSSTEFDGWRVHFELTSDHGQTWQRTSAINDGKEFGAIQPTLLHHPDGTIQALCRNKDGDGLTLSTSSSDLGLTWSDLQPIKLPNPNSGIDGVTLQNGHHLLVYNHTSRNKGTPRGREMINVAVSDNGIDWKPALTLDREPRAEFSYPAVIQSADGKVHITYTWQRRKIRYFIVDADKLVLKDWDGGAWPE